MQSLPVLLCVTVRVPKQQDQQRPLDRAPRPAEGPLDREEGPLDRPRGPSSLCLLLFLFSSLIFLMLCVFWFLR